MENGGRNGPREDAREADWPEEAAETLRGVVQHTDLPAHGCVDRAGRGDGQCQSDLAQHRKGGNGDRALGGDVSV